ncbi:MAG TPA: hypothetical protein VKI44_03535 [Acetobacteraceae bacterium]|nr:hypothetical protein [Acetobacteraceae bacterium]
MMENREACLAWINDIFGLDLEGAPQEARVGAGSAALGAQPVSFLGRGKKKKTGGDDAGGTDIDDTGSKGGKPPKDVTLKLTSETEAKQPSPRNRTKLGVGERVTLKLKPLSGDWVVAGGGSVNPAKGSKVVFTAPGAPGTCTVTVTAAGKTEQITFTVIGPSTVSMERRKIRHDAVGYPNAGFVARIFVGPDDVNFCKIGITEDDCPCVCTGYWADFNGIGHGANPDAVGLEQKVEKGMGTRMVGQDNIWSGYIDTRKLDDWTGTQTFNIPWNYSCDGNSARFTTVVHQVTTDAKGTSRATKGGASSGDCKLK